MANRGVAKGTVFSRRLIVDAVARRTGITKRDVCAVWAECIEEVKNQLLAGHKVAIRKFGTLKITKYKAGIMKGRLDGKFFSYPDSYRIYFHNSDVMQKRLNPHKVKINGL